MTELVPVSPVDTAAAMAVRLTVIAHCVLRDGAVTLVGDVNIAAQVVDCDACRRGAGGNRPVGTVAVSNGVKVPSALIEY